MTYKEPGILSIRLSIVITIIYMFHITSVKCQEANYDETLIPLYTLPDPLMDNQGNKIAGIEQWEAKRRREILELFRKNVYGVSPDRPENMAFRVLQNDTGALNGKATRREIEIIFPDVPELSLIMLIYLPNKATIPVPMFLGLNFQGNCAIHNDSSITISPEIIREVKGETDKLEKRRGSVSHRWPVELLLDNGYGLATIYRGDIDPDYDDGFKNGVHALTPAQRRDDDWGTIAAWAWGLSRAMDYLVIDTNVDAQKIAVIGHSRLGKAALWAGAQDERIALVISNNSGCGGAALFRRKIGETIWKINDSFPHWFCSRFHTFNNKEESLPVDQHELIALIAPRPVYVASAEDDLWADPKGEFLSALHAGPVYNLYGLGGLMTDKMPEVNKPLHKGSIGYHLRTGKHGITQYDWEQYILFCDKYFK